MVPAGEGRVHVRPVVGEALPREVRSPAHERDARDAGRGRATKGVVPLQPLFDASPDGVYVWLDEEHWICNRRFAELLGYDWEFSNEN